MLCLSGHDPTGGAGLQADIETIAALGGHALGVITAYTIQDTRNVHRVAAPPLAWFKQQLATVLRDVPIAAIKIGLLAGAEQVPVIAATIRKARVPVVLDPVLRAGGGRNLADARLIAAIRRRLLPLADIATPNVAELMRLMPGGGPVDRAAQRWLAAGAGSVLVTGGDSPGDFVANSWHRPGHAAQRQVWPRVPGEFHGAGCTLAAAIAILLARGFSLAAAVTDAQAYAHEALRRGRRIGRGRAIPWRKGTAA